MGRAFWNKVESEKNDLRQRVDKAEAACKKLMQHRYEADYGDEIQSDQSYFDAIELARDAVGDFKPEEAIAKVDDEHVIKCSNCGVTWKQGEIAPMPRTRHGGLWRAHFSKHGWWKQNDKSGEWAFVADKGHP